MKKLFFLLVFMGLLSLSRIAQAQVVSDNGSYLSVLKIPSLDNAPLYFYVNTNIPATDTPAPEIQITGYMYASSNKSLKLTLSWYHYAGQFYWSQFHSDLGYHKPSRIRLGTYAKNGTNYIRIEIANDGMYWSNYTFSATDRADLRSYYLNWTYQQGEMPTGTSQITQVPLEDNIVIQGNVGIGTGNLSEKLSVNGKIRAKEIKVEASNWPDYVFEDDYKQASLSELESYVLKYKHLPDIPSAKEVEKNGVELGALNKSLLMKIEELTLHLIDKDKIIRKAETEIQSSKQRISVLEKDMISLKQAITNIKLKK
ncbi:hypothetical protein QWY86_15645 [Pedobacter aquatilis]|uniref:hypothetical protein n=1 Tax=Pedobacter aquatilis TaxID=351343 RepID=UPI0025B3EFF1|nr:hypothetical protein [Pedobacter aquatilis]MDN3588117.1 hypothetical protein [Pedobacter aquatilis]